MRRVICLLWLLALMSCERDPQQRTSMTLICKQDGHETYRSTTDWWYFRDGAWLSGYGGPQYKPSLLESCHTEVSSATAALRGKG